MVRRIVFTERELEDLAKSWLVISLAFTFIITEKEPLLIGMLISAITVGLGFILHELAHKITAMRLGYWAEFRAWTTGLALTATTAVLAWLGLGIVFAAPGAVMISGFVSRKDSGFISAAGPLANIILSFAFLFLMPITKFAAYGVMINAWLALFNLIPLPPLDGFKVFAWSKTTAITLIFIALTLSGIPTALQYI